jgi:Carboxypeptidase regulatory-like domain/TonB dependent receptor-like, beta-barrel
MVRKVRWCVVVFVVLAQFAGPAAKGQGTTNGILSGRCIDQSGEHLPGVQVVVLHEPTGVTSSAACGEDGRFTLPNTRVGGPYALAGKLDGFRDARLGGVYVRLGEETHVTLELALESFEERLLVVGDSDLISPGRTGVSSTVSLQQIETLPTVSRSLEDFARTNPFFTINPENDQQNRLSVAGRNSRYNNISIDGAVNNDVFGLSGNGAPGGTSEAAPISIDAIAELQLAVTPFDVRQGGFAGGAIDAVTRSGTNQLVGSVYWFQRDEGLIGDGPEGFPEFGAFSEEQLGFRLGGPIRSDKLFYFVNLETSDREQPTGFSIGGATGRNFGYEEEAARFEQILTSQYGHDAGGTDQVSRQTIRDQREFDQAFPYVLVLLGGGNQFEAGTERFSQANSLDQDIVELTNDLTWLRGSHSLTVGAHSEQFSFDNPFIRELFGAYRFADLDAFERGEAFQLDRSFSATGDELESAQFDAHQVSLYAGDQWRVRDRVTLSLGLRADTARFPDQPGRNPTAESSFGRRTDVVPSESIVWSPRLAFNWDIGGRGDQRDRPGGPGLQAAAGDATQLGLRPAAPVAGSRGVRGGRLHRHAPGDPLPEPQHRADRQGGLRRAPGVRDARSELHRCGTDHQHEPRRQHQCGRQDRAALPRDLVGLLDAYIESDAGLRAHRGGIVPRNASREPWFHQLDLRLAQDIPVRKAGLQITLDVENLGNLLDRESGVVQFANFNAVSPVGFAGVDEATGKPIYVLNSIVTDPANSPRFGTDDLRSRWRARLGLRLSF